jgi:hypothetical protein
MTERHSSPPRMWGRGQGEGVPQRMRASDVSSRCQLTDDKTKCPAFQPGIPNHKIQSAYLPRIVTGT